MIHFVPSKLMGNIKVLLGHLLSLDQGIIIIYSCRKAPKSQRVITLEDVDSSTAVAVSSVVHKQQPEAKDIHSRVQDLYPPPTNPHNSRSSLVTTENNDHKIVKKVLPEPSLPCLQKPIRSYTCCQCTKTAPSFSSVSKFYPTRYSSRCG